MKLFDKPTKERDHQAGDGIQKLYFFDNGYGASVARLKMGSDELGLFKLAKLIKGENDDVYGSYTSNENEWEVGILKGDIDDYSLTYDTHITDDVLGHLTEDEVEDVLQEVKSLKEAK